MAQTRKRRRRKHRGTQSGSIDRRRAARPRSRKEAQSRARSRQSNKRDQAPTWSGAVTRGLIAAGLFFALIVVVFRQPVLQALGLAILMLAFYIPMGYFIDRFFYNRRQRQRQAERQGKA
jgi:Flp pilus assembly protein TadB